MLILTTTTKSLGIAEAGKSTVVKQMKLSWGAGITNEERMLFVDIIHFNLLKTATAVMDAVEEEWRQSNEWSAQVEHAMEVVRKCYSDPKESNKEDLLQAVNVLLSYERYQKMLKEVNLLKLPEGGPRYVATGFLFGLMFDECRFMRDAQRLLAKDYAPTDDDVLNARSQTLGFAEYKFEMPTAGRLT